MPKKSLANENDTAEVNRVIERNSNSKKIIKIENKAYIRIMSIEYNTEFVHFIDKKPYVCLGDFSKDEGYAPKKCPACASVEKKWNQYNEAKKEKKENLMKKILDEINDIQTQHQTAMGAVKGNITTEENEDGELESRIVWEKEAKCLLLSSAQWRKLTSSIFEDYEYMKSSKDIINRSLLFVKKSKTNKKTNNKYSEIEIKPSKKKSDPPEIENELPDLEEFFNHVSREEMEDLLNEGSEESKNLKEIDEDLELDQEEEKPKKKKSGSKKTTTKSKKKTTKKKEEKYEDLEDEDEDDDVPDFVKDSDEDLEKTTEEEDDDDDDFDDDLDFEDDEDYDDFDDED